jgi:hypothetical protein
MWHAVIEPEGRNRHGYRLTLNGDRGGGLTAADVVSLWASDPHFGGWFSGILAGLDSNSFRWETPPLAASDGSLDRPFECMVIDDPGLASPRADPTAFEAHLRKASKEGVAVFANLGGDATLVVPEAIGKREAYGHLAAFVRRAPAAQQVALWTAVGRAMRTRLESRTDRPVWLSTAGAGVPWLHVRLDDRPKYYRHSPYRQWIG